MGLKERAGPLAVLGAFVLSRVAYYQAGIRFDAGGLSWYWQFLDARLLETDLARSLFYLHSQPPLFNLFLGAVLGIARDGSTAAFAAIYLVLGATLTLVLYFLMRRLGVGRMLASALTILFVASPAAILYESWLFYTYPLAVALAGSALALDRFLEAGRRRDAALLAALLAIPALTWSPFHFGWVVLAAVFIAMVSPAPMRRRAVAVGMAALIVVGAIYVKNGILFGVFSASSWAGMSLAKMTLHVAPAEARGSLVEAGVLSPLALHPPFWPVDAYPASYREIEPRGVAAIDAPEKAPRVPNFNHLSYIGLSQQYARDSRAMMTRHPAVYARSVGIAMATYALPSSSYAFLRRNRASIEGWSDAFDRYVLGAFAAGPTAERCTDLESLDCLGRNVAYGWIAIAVVATAWGLGRGVSGLRRAGELNRRPAATLVFLAAIVLWVTIAANATEVGENNRFRFVVDPLIVALAAAAVTDVGGRISLRPRN